LVALSFSLSSAAQVPGLSGARLTATILAQHDCKTSAEYHSVFLGVKLQLQNDAALPFEVTFPLGGVVIISRTLADVKAGRHEFQINAPETMMPPAPGELAKVKYKSVSPGQSIESVSNNLQLVPAQDGDEDGLKPGKHYLQIQIDGFFKNPGSPETPSIYQRVTSAPIPFYVDRYPVPVDCSAMIKNDP
jgi:hypothetical protein